MTWASDMGKTAAGVAIGVPVGGLTLAYLQPKLYQLTGEPALPHHQGWNDLFTKTFTKSVKDGRWIEMKFGAMIATAGVVLYAAEPYMSRWFNQARQEGLINLSQKAVQQVNHTMAKIAQAFRPKQQTIEFDPEFIEHVLNQNADHEHTLA